MKGAIVLCWNTHMNPHGKDKSEIRGRGSWKKETVCSLWKRKQMVKPKKVRQEDMRDYDSSEERRRWHQEKDQQKMLIQHLRLKQMSQWKTHKKNRDIFMCLSKHSSTAEHMVAQHLISPFWTDFLLLVQPILLSNLLFICLLSTRSANCTLLLRQVRMRRAGEREWRCWKMSRTRKMERRDSTHTKSTICRGKHFHSRRLFFSHRPCLFGPVISFSFLLSVPIHSL